MAWTTRYHQPVYYASYLCDTTLVEFLESGLLDAATIEAVIDRYLTEGEVMTAREAANSFMKRAYWDHHVDEKRLLAEATDLVESAHLLDPFVATELQSVVAKLPGGATIGEAIVDSWIAGYKASNPVPANHENPFNNPLHPKIQAAFASARTNAEAKTTVVDACIHILERSGWGALQEVALRQATAADFEVAIRGTEDLDTLRRFMREMMKMRVQHANYDPHFGTATERFMEACRAIAKDATAPRLASLIARLFEGSTLASELKS